LLDAEFTEESLARGGGNYPFKTELNYWRFAVTLKPDGAKATADRNALPERVDYNFRVEADRVAITPRRRGSPPDKVVSELMILANSHWGGLLAEHDIPALYRVQQAGKVRMSPILRRMRALGLPSMPGRVHRSAVTSIWSTSASSLPM
jgi:exoribonuclease-2